MLQKLFIALFIIIYSAVSLQAGNVVVKSKHDIMHVVPAGNSKLNGINRKLVQVDEKNNQDLKKVIQKANAPLVDIRSVLFPYDVTVTEKTVKAIQGNLDALATLLDEVDEKLDKTELIEKINKIGEEAGAVLNGLKKKK